MKKDNKYGLFFLSFIVILFGGFGWTCYYPTTAASMSSIRKLNTCGREVISRVVNSNGVLATHSEVDAAKSICADLAMDRKKLAQAKQDHNTVFAKYFAKALSVGSYQKIADKIDDSEEFGLKGNDDGVIGYVHDYHVYHDLYKYGLSNTFFNRDSIYAIYAPDGILRRYHNMLKYESKENRLAMEEKVGRP